MVISKISIETPTLIPPRSEKFVEAKLVQTDNIERAEGLLESVKGFGSDQGLMIPRCLVSVENNRLFSP